MRRQGGGGGAPRQKGKENVNTVENRKMQTENANDMKVSQT